MLNKNLKRILIILAIIFAVLFVIALIGSIKFPWQQSFRVVFGSFYVLFLPGFVWSYVFFGLKKEDEGIIKQQKDKEVQNLKEKPLDGIERVILSFALSLALSPLILFFLNRVGLKISFWSSFFVILGIIAIGIIIIVVKNIIKNKK